MVSFMIGLKNQGILLSTYSVSGLVSDSAFRCCCFNLKKNNCCFLFL